jgi:adenylosuccinate synthase
MAKIAVLGSQMGDEGKGHVTHHLSKDFDWVIRFSGGANAGHTIYRDGKKYVHNLLPSFDWRYPNAKAFLGAGMVIDLEQLQKEVSALADTDELKANCGKIYVDPDAFVVLQNHKDTDRAINAHIGSTNKGIGPAFVDKVGRKGIRIKDLLKEPSTNSHVQSLTKMGVHFKHALELRGQMENENLLFEGAQGVMIDLNHGTYPYVSCGDSTVAGVYLSGFAWVRLDRVYGVAKCYMTKVGEGPFPTEMFGEEAQKLRVHGNEYGATTGRPRRLGHIDLPALDYACKKGGITHLIVTKFDILNGMKSVKACVSYQKTPVCPDDFFNAEPAYVDVPGWDDAKDIGQLKSFIDLVESSVGIPIELVSCGVGSDDIMRTTSAI